MSNSLCGPCQHSTTDLATGLMTNQRKQSALSKAWSFKHSKTIQAAFLYSIYHQRAGKTNLFHMRGVDFIHFNTCCTFNNFVTTFHVHMRSAYIGETEHNYVDGTGYFRNLIELIQPISGISYSSGGYCVLYVVRQRPIITAQLIGSGSATSPDSCQRCSLSMAD